ncbi:STING domain-containing protein [Confluentibacter citreus]|uniref:STING domain-containing protein n=1 Tax=Confluentibacter citreus TaxID=2007307 RepID=UPI000C291DFA|nr:STING domain-containing protein [Confluentibacter citreus]
MSNILSIIKDIIISAIIAILTSGFFGVSNMIYQSIITILILVIIFLILRGIDKKAKRLEILSILYVEQFIAPLMDSIHSNQNLNLGGVSFDKVKILVVLPQSLAELNETRDNLAKLERFEIELSNSGNRKIFAQGKQIGKNQLILFDTPVSWIASLSYLTKAEGFSEKKVSQLLHIMTEDIKSYVNKAYKQSQFKGHLMFIPFSDFQSYYA